MNIKIGKIIKVINSPKLFPQSFLRRNRSSYAFVCNVNNLIAFCIADNQDGIDACIRRMDKTLESSIDEIDLIDLVEHKDYFEAVDKLVELAKGGNSHVKG